MQELLNVKAAGTYRDHSALKGYIKRKAAPLRHAGTKEERIYSSYSFLT
jgi:hypothetical protein